MNKSIILVMCDILVLSAMSLSEGGFIADEYDVRFSQGDSNSVFVPKAEYDELKRLLQSRESLVAAAKADAVRARSEAEQAKRGEVAARNEAEVARKGEEHARNEAEVAKAQADRANGVAAAAKLAAAGADAKRKTAEADAVRARSEAEQAKRGEVAARNEAEAARKGEEHARSEAEVAKAQADRANGVAAAAKLDAARVIKELNDIKRRQRMLKGEIPTGFAQKLQFLFLNGGQCIRYSPLLKIDGKCYAMVDIGGLGVDEVHAIEKVRIGTGSATTFSSIAFRLNSDFRLYFIHIPNADQSCAIQCGIDHSPLEDNLVFYVESGNFSGNPVSCEVNADGFFCSVKTETRTLASRILKGKEESHSVYEGCFLLSAKCGAMLGIVRGDEILAQRRKCDLIKPVSKLDLIPLDND